MNWFALIEFSVHWFFQWKTLLFLGSVTLEIIPRECNPSFDEWWSFACCELQIYVIIMWYLVERIPRKHLISDLRRAISSRVRFSGDEHLSRCTRSRQSRRWLTVLLPRPINTGNLIRELWPRHSTSISVFQWMTNRASQCARSVQRYYPRVEHEMQILDACRGSRDSMGRTQ